MKATLSFSKFVVVVQFLLVLLDAIVKVTGGQFVACDGSRYNSMKCKLQNHPVICITSNITLRKKASTVFCPGSPPANPNQTNCTEKTVEEFIKKKCNGKQRVCMPFKRFMEISEHCEGAFHHAMLSYDCVASLSKCPTIPSHNKEIITFIYPSSSSPNIMAGNGELSTKLLPTKAIKNQVKNTNKDESSPLNPNSPAKPAPGPESEYRPSSSSGPISNSSETKVLVTKSTCTPRKGGKSSNPKTTPTKTRVSSGPTKGGRNSGYSSLNIRHFWKFYVMIGSILFAVLL